MTQRELDTIDIRADREILSLVSCAVFLRQLTGKRVTKALEKRHRTALSRFLSHFGGDTSICIQFRFNKLPNGAPDFSDLGLEADVCTEQEMEERRHAWDNYEDEDDDE